MSLDAQQLQNWFVTYKFAAERSPPGPERAVAMLGMMACCAASWDDYRAMPQEWGWPRVPRTPEDVPRTPRAQN